MILAVPKHAPSRWSPDLLCWELCCRECRDWWPCDTEFFKRYQRDPRQADTLCHACRAERKEAA